MIRKVDYREVAMVDSLVKLVPSGPYSLSTEDIKVTIAIKRDSETGPRNFRVESDTPKTSTGGCFARIFASAPSGEQTTERCNLFAYYGPSITYGDIRDYTHAARALTRIDKRLEEIYKVRGCPQDAGDSMGRWLEATGIKEVWMRPKHERHNQWLSEGDWKQLTIGQFLYEVRCNLYKGAETLQLAEVAS